MAQIDDDRPHIVIAKDSFGCRHARWRYTVFDDPLKLSVAVSLNISRRQRRDWRRYTAAKGNACILSVSPVTDDAVKAKGLFSSLDLLGSFLDWILIVRAANGDIVLGPLHDRGLGPAGRTYLAPDQGYRGHAS
jgi:hypothetical protein